MPDTETPCIDDTAVSHLFSTSKSLNLTVKSTPA